MRIPLDYYRILCVGVQASADKIAESYRDRVAQSLLGEFSELAQQARRQLLDVAIEELQDPEKRDRYDRRFFQGGLEAIEPSLDLEDWQRIGALLILLELGEYDRVSQLATELLPELDAGNELRDQISRNDSVLALALAQQALSQEAQQQKQYELAAQHLSRGRDLLEQRQLFPVLARDLQQQQRQLRPYRILDRLAQDLSAKSDRQQGLLLLQEMLDDRQGIDGPGDDGSGLALDNFLRFLQQIRSYLTLAEQQLLFESEARRPSPAGSFFACYALIARGFHDHQPSLIHRASLLLQDLQSRMDVQLERAIVELLLGRPEQAETLLSQSQDAETLAQVRSLAKGEALIVGLCRFSEDWLTNKVFIDFRDLQGVTAQLQPYFDDPDVQTYLDAMVDLPPDLIPAPIAPDALEEMRSTLFATERPTTTPVTLPSLSAKRRRRNRPARTAKGKLSRWLGLGIGILVVGAGSIWAWRSFSQSASRPRPSPVVTQAPPVAAIPATPAPAAALDRQQAQQVIENWLAAKAAALGPDYASDRLATILTGSALQRWQGFAAVQAQSQLTSRFEHQVTVENVQVEDGDQRAVVQAKVDEVERVYRDGNTLTETREDRGLVIRYQLVRDNGVWKIASSNVVR